MSGLAARRHAAPTSPGNLDWDSSLSSVALLGFLALGRRGQSKAGRLRNGLPGQGELAEVG